MCWHKTKRFELIYSQFFYWLFQIEFCFSQKRYFLQVAEKDQINSMLFAIACYHRINLKTIEQLSNCVLRTGDKVRRIYEVLQIWEKIGQHSFDSFFWLSRPETLFETVWHNDTLFSARFKWSVKMWHKIPHFSYFIAMLCRQESTI